MKIKRCKICHKGDVGTNFKTNRQIVCNDCQREKNRQRQAKWNARMKQKRQEVTIWLEGYKAERGCARCKESDYRCLEAHHINGIKKGERHISSLYLREKILEELKKCEILCANCHKKHHYQ